MVPKYRVWRQGLSRCSSLSPGNRGTWWITVVAHGRDALSDILSRSIQVESPRLFAYPARTVRRDFNHMEMIVILSCDGLRIPGPEAIQPTVVCGLHVRLINRWHGQHTNIIV